MKTKSGFKIGKLKLKGRPGIIPIAVILLIATVLSGCGSKDTESTHIELNVSAAVSLVKPLDSIKADYEKTHPGTKITINYGSSGSLQTQIENGSKTDIFISAAKRNMDYIEKKKLIEPNTREDLLMNRMVLITPANKTKAISMRELNDSSVKRIALGEPQSVPAGKYAQEALKSLGVFDEAVKKAVYAKDVRAVLSWVETGNADAGIVYYSDTKGNNKVRVVEVIDDNTHSRIILPMAMLSGSSNKDDAKAFMEFLKSDTSDRIFESYGFMVIKK